MSRKEQGVIVAIVVIGTLILGLTTLLLATTSMVQEMTIGMQNATVARHVDPSKLKPVPPPSKILENMIASSFKALAEGNINEALKLVNILNETVLPRKWKLVVEDVVADLAKLVQLMENTTILEKRIKTETNLNNISGILEACKEAKRLLADLNITYNTLVDRIDRLEKLGVSTTLLREKLEKIVPLTQQLKQHVHKTLLEIKLAQHRLHATKLWLNITPNRVFYGEDIVVKGCLAGGKMPLPGKPIILHYDNRTIQLYTDANGCFKTTIEAVTEKDYITIYAEYIPKGRDRLLYTYTRSHIIYVEVLRVKPILIVYAYDNIVYPGNNVTIHIFSNIEGIEVIIKAFNTTRKIKLEKTSTNYTLYVPPYIPAGIHNVTVLVPQQSGFRETNATDWIIVVRKPLKARIHVPSMAFAGFDLPITLHANTTVRMLIATPWHTYTAVLSSNKTHIAKVHVPITYPNVFVSVKVILEPLDPCYEKHYAEYSVAVLNPLALTTLFTTLSIVLVPLFQQRQIEHAKKLAKPIKTFPREKERGTATYAGLLKHVEGIIGVRLLFNETLREYLARVRKLLDNNSYRVLEEIVYVYEAVLYGGRRELMRELINRVKELEKVMKCSQQKS